MSAHARSLPHIGWDPAPGDVGGTQALASKHAQAVTELNAINTLLRSIDLGRWQGDAREATEVQVFNAVLPALQAAITDAGKMAEASKGWSGQLAGFQGEADALERQAKTADDDLKSLQNSPAGASPGQQKVRSMSIQDAQDSVSGIQDKAHELNERYLEAAKKASGEGEGESKSWAEQTEPYRVIIEGVLAPFDIIAADHWLSLIEKVGAKPGELLEEVDKAIESAVELRSEGKSAVDALIEAAKVLEKAGGEIDELPAWAGTAERSLGWVRGGGWFLTGLGVLADAGTIAFPPDKGAMGWVDRGAAGVNGALLIANATMDEIPVVGEVVMIGTGLYLAGDFLYHHFKPFTNLCNGIGHGTVAATKWVGHAASKAWHTVTSWF